MRNPDYVTSGTRSGSDRAHGLIVQNGNAHDDGAGSRWESARAPWADPSEENRASLPDHTTHQPPCLVLWGRHDTYFDLAEIMPHDAGGPARRPAPVASVPADDD